MTAALTVSLLGGLRVVGIAGEERSLTTRKHRALLAYLVVNRGRPLPRDRLAGLLWSDRSEQQARRSLAQAFYDIRRTVCSDRVTLTEQHGTVTLSADAIHTDLDELTALARSHGEDALRRTTSIVVGPFLEGLDMDEEPFDQWLRERRENARELAISVYSGFASSFLATSDYQCAIEATRQALLIDPLNEHIHQLFVSSLVKAGRRAEAIHHANEFKRRLWIELGLKPSAEFAVTLSNGSELGGDRSSSSSVQQEPRPAGRTQPVIGVIPFELIGDGASTYLATGLAEEISAELCRFHSLTVLARDSVRGLGRSGSGQPHAHRRTRAPCPPGSRLGS